MPHEARRFSPAWSPEEKCSTPIPEVTRQVIVSRLPFFTGEVLPRYAGDLDDGTVRELLDELATQMGQCLEQEEVHIAYRDRTWTLKADE